MGFVSLVYIYEKWNLKVYKHIDRERNDASEVVWAVMLKINLYSSWLKVECSVILWPQKLSISQNLLWRKKLDLSRRTESWPTRQCNRQVMAQVCDPRLPASPGDLLLFMLHTIPAVGNRLLWNMNTDSCFIEVRQTTWCYRAQNQPISMSLLVRSRLSWLGENPDTECDKLEEVQAVHCAKARWEVKVSGTWRHVAGKLYYCVFGKHDIPKENPDRDSPVRYGPF